MAAKYKPCLVFTTAADQAEASRIGEALLVIAAVLTIWSGLQYVRVAWPILRQQR